MKYLHFTSPKDAREIIRSGELWPSSYISGIYAVAVGARQVKEVQLSKLGRTSDRSMAVVFETDELPDVAFPEEVIWHLPVLKIKNAKMMPTEDAMHMLTDTIGTNEDDWLDIPVHPSKIDMQSFERVRMSNKKQESAQKLVAQLMEEDRRKRLFGMNKKH